ncbi:prolipoprotein diacylglyceryl transferase [Anaerolineae bacterium CFX9]|jgi:phosphatidylglycerol:prolipoprotein diacylglycerol transferase|nr:prolipoprotein diacylglyceryl transferase [Anaerolineae bacterium CFX9]
MEFQSEYIVLFDRLQIRYYGIIIVAAMLIGAMVAARLAKRAGKDPDHVWGALTWAIIPAIVLARLWFVLFPPISLTASCTAPGVGDGCMDTTWFLQNFFNLNNGAIAIWSGGLSIFGAVIGGGLGAYLYLRRNKLPVWEWLDIAGVALPLGQAIGRWANFVNQELYGTVTTLPWGITIQSSKRVDPFRSIVDYPVGTTLFHPLFLYEALWNGIAFVVLLNLFLRDRRRGAVRRFRDGDFFLFYVMQYAVIRFLLEFIRVEVTLVAGVNWSQVVCVIAFAGALIVYLIRRRQPLPTPPQQTSQKPA